MEQLINNSWKPFSSQPDLKRLKNRELAEYFEDEDLEFPEDESTLPQLFEKMTETHADELTQLLQKPSDKEDQWLNERD